MVMTVFLTGCDPVGLRRICVPVSQRPNDSATIEIHRPDVQEVLRVLDAVVEPLGFKVSPEPTTNGSIRVYWLHRQPATVEVRIPTKSDTQSDPYRTACRFISDSCRSEATLGGDL